MLPIGSGTGQLLHHNLHLCDIFYEIDYPLGFANVFLLHRLRFRPQEHEPTALLTLSNLTLVTADGTQYPLPPSLTMAERGYLECTVNLKD